MGCGASIGYSSGLEMVHRIAGGGEAPGGKKDNIRRDRPDAEVVTAESSHPEWDHADLLVFEKPHPGGQFEDGGRFYSKRSRNVGSWKVTNNVLLLNWEDQRKPEMLRAEVSELIWVNDQSRMKVTVLEPEILPDWFAPPFLSKRFESTTQAENNFECNICYFELYRFPAGVLRKHSRRVCPHYFHADCANFLKKQSKRNNVPRRCPVCQAEFTDVKVLPDLLKDPRGWFTIVDADFGGTLDQDEVINALGAVLPVDRKKLQRTVDSHWHEWDPDGDMTIDVHEFLSPDRGLREYIIKHLADLKKESGQVRANDIPSLDTHPRKWFEYWDVDRSGSLEKDELARALMRTFAITSWGDPVLSMAHDMREICDVIWKDLGYHEFDAVEFEEFIKPHGVADTFLHNQIHCAFFGEDNEA